MVSSFLLSAGAGGILGTTWCFFFVLAISAAAGQDGSWTEWSAWTPCSVSCGKGVVKQFRNCEPPPRAGGKWCPGKFVKTKECQPTGGSCPRDGGWSSWSAWTGCSATCGEGTKERFRSCSDPIPQDGGRECQGTQHQKETCFELQDCPRDGQWSEWSGWSQCTVTCGEGGSQHRYRSCNDPPPRAGGRYCDGPGQDTRPCLGPRSCPVNGQWAEWSVWSQCSVTCNQGERRRFRECANPSPLNGGQDCDRTEAQESQIESCIAEIRHCPVVGGWSEWSPWGSCNSPACHLAASDGTKALSMRQRSCSSPVPEHGGAMCQGTFLDAGLCAHPHNCVVDGQWSDWSEWSCESPRPGGRPTVVKRNRKCNNPAPSNGGKKCPGKDVEFFSRDDDFFREKCGHLVGDNEEEEYGIEDDEEGNGDEKDQGEDDGDEKKLDEEEEDEKNVDDGEDEKDEYEDYDEEDY